MKFDVVGFAAINEDRTIPVSYNVEGSEIFSCDQPGNLNSKEKAFLGGSVINSLAGLAKYGHNVATIGLLGNDSTGIRQRGKLKKYGIDFFGEVTEGYSGVAKIVVGRNKERNIVIYPGVNDRFDVNEVHRYRNLIANCRLFHSSTFACAFEWYDSLKSQIEFVRLAKTIGVKCSLSFGLLYCDIFERKPAIMKELLDGIDILILNEQELARIIKRVTYQTAAVDIMDTYKIELIAVTLGEKGSHVFSESEDYFVEAIQVRKVDLIGAGDAFTAGFLVGYLHNKNLYTCAKFGNLNAAKCIQTEGAVDYKTSSVILKSL